MKADERVSFRKKGRRRERVAGWVRVYVFGIQVLNCADAETGQKRVGRRLADLLFIN